MADFEQPIFVGQPILLEFDTKQVLTGGTLKLRYYDPKNDTGQWTGSIKGTDDSVIQCTATFTIPGIWRLQADVIFADLTPGYGRVRTIKVLAIGQVN